MINSANNARSILIREMAENGNLKRFSEDEARRNRHVNQLIELCKNDWLTDNKWASGTTQRNWGFNPS